MSFYKIYSKWKEKDFKKLLGKITEKDVEKAIDKNRLDEKDYLALLSPIAKNYLEEMAQKAHRLTVQNFGKVIYLYAPLYLANYCDNECSYCGFNTENQVKRKKLNLQEVKQEGKAVLNKGIKHILLLTGCSRAKTPVSYIQDCVKTLKDDFASISIEVYTLRQKEYQTLIDSGVTGLTIYQEVYDEQVYNQVHLKGPKTNYKFRLNAPERGCKAGMRKVNIGPLLGLTDWRREVFFAGLHAQYLQNKYLETKITLSVPRLQPHPGVFEKKDMVSDRAMVQAILAYRLFLPRTGINLSTRESAELRDNLLPLGITKISAESSTVVGGYNSREGNEQFAIDDNRKVSEIKQILLNKGYQPVFKNWHPID